MLRKGYVFLPIVFLVKALTQVCYNNGNQDLTGEFKQIFPRVSLSFSLPPCLVLCANSLGTAPFMKPAILKLILFLPPAPATTLPRT